MERYKNLSGQSGVFAFEIGENSILVQFADRKKYLYTNASAGRENLVELKRLAVDGFGLNAYINRHVRDRYEWKGF